MAQSSCCLSCGYGEELPIANAVWIPSCESDLCTGYFTKPFSKNASLCAWTKVYWEKIRVRIINICFPPTFHPLGTALLGDLLGSQGVLLLWTPVKITPKTPGGFCYVVGFYEPEILLLARPELAACCLLNHTRVSGDSFRKLLTSFWALLASPSQGAQSVWSTLGNARKHCLLQQAH